MDRFSSSLELFRFSLRLVLGSTVFCFTFLFGVEFNYGDWKTLCLDLFGSVDAIE